MPVVNREVTSPGERGLGPQALNVLGHWYGFPNSSGTANVFSLTGAQVSSSSSSTASVTTGAGSTITTNISATTWSSAQSFSTTVGTQLDYCRNLAYSLSNSANSAQLTGGTISVAGVDLFNNVTSETMPVSRLKSAGTFFSGTLNFAKVTGMTALLVFAGSSRGSTQSSDSNAGTTTSSAGSAAASVTFRAGAGAKLGVLPIEFKRIDAVVWASIKSIPRTTTGYSTTSGVTGNTVTTSSGDFVVFTGPYNSGGFSFTSAITSTEGMEISYKLNGRNLF